ncbi:sulfatase-like hydrolase/transferase [Halapricum sp. CBA1109]|uniref:sulfatase-like hydrolase/transferase n=1 Tax=Halapricum sp. CBA1109 TaxID=2668068 RepID=UPI0012F9D72B|nr:sulfatase-like hydrolase/transferase [Halapricum sp. CBA1109]MUV88787.1 sulfatase-like hydrolase/transferase [Halapricum sp. CBA1109]
MDPHTPHHPDSAVDIPEISHTDDELREINDRFTDGRRDGLSDAEMSLATTLYDANVRYLDRELARLLRWLRRQPWYSDALIAIVSDHGELLGEYGLTFHPWGADPHDELVRTPLLVKYPNGDHAGSSYDHLTGHRNLYSTLTSNSNSPSNSIPCLTEATDQRIVSLSNGAVRVTEKTGYLVGTRDGTVRTEGTVSSEAREVANKTALPVCQNMSGEKPGVDTQQMEDRLEALGYK